MSLKNTDIHNKKINVLVCIGTRPEGIKLAPLINALKNQNEKFILTICSTGQHREMLKQVFDFFEIIPDINLDLMSSNQSLDSLSVKILAEIGKVFSKVKPDIVIIQGDTTTAFLTALSAFYNKIKVGHVEAGLRTFDKYNPFPEEINRQLISRVADLHFAPTGKAYESLLKENVEKTGIFLTGNTIVDAIMWGIEKIKKNRDIIETAEPFTRIKKDKKLILVTMHRRESFGEDIIHICGALKVIAQKYEDIQIIYPVHLNPNVRKPVFQILGELENVVLCDPLNYEYFIWLMYKSYLIVTDSGGVQEEAPTLKKPVLVIRKKTEREESVALGISRLIGVESKDIVYNISNLIENKRDYGKMIADVNPYGDGHAADKIAESIYNRLKANNTNQGIL